MNYQNHDQTLATLLNFSRELYSMKDVESHLNESHLIGFEVKKISTRSSSSLITHYNKIARNRSSLEFDAKFCNTPKQRN